MYEVRLDKRALKKLKKMDRFQARMIMQWIEKNLVETNNPRLHGKGLTGDMTGYWRYRVGNYRLIADIQDNIVTIVILDLGHRRDVYEN